MPDDYVSKPFGMMELVSRVRALLRRTVPQPGEGVLSCGPVTVDDGRHQVTVNGQPITLTLKEYDLLHFLLRKPGHGIFQGKAAAGRVGIRL